MAIYSEGRNGGFQTIGISMYRYMDEVYLHGITSKGKEGRGRIAISLNSVDQLIKTLEQIKETQNFETLKFYFNKKEK